jgi:hypothetical protein
MLFGNYLFFCEFRESAILPPYKGSTFRGVFGQTLKKIVCALKKKNCAECLLNENCVYFFVFETPDKKNKLSVKKRIASPPHPYVIEPPLTDQTNFSVGDSFKFNLLLFGKANDYLPYFIYTFDQIGEKGIGKRSTNFRGKFILKEVSSSDQILYSYQDKKIKGDYQLQELTLKNFVSPSTTQIEEVELSLLTPLRVKFQNQLLKTNGNVTLPFHILTRTMLRRVASLFNYYDDGEPPLDYRQLIEKARMIEIKQSSLKWYDWRRYSNRQDQTMLIGGIVGDISYQGNITDFFPLLRFSELVHLGKQTSFGLGKIEIKRVKQKL